MATNLLRHGFKVTVWNKTLSKCEELVQYGASVGERPATVVKKCKYTIAMLSDPPAALSIVFDKDGVLDHINGKGYIDMSTVDADTSSKTSEALYDEALPAFDILGKKSFFLGEVGNGAKMKLVVNMIMAVIPRCSMMNAFSEGLTLGERSGLNPTTLLDVLDLGAISNGMFKLKGPTMLQNSYSPAFPLKHQQKDMRLALALGDENVVSMPIAAAANEAFKKARSMGLGDLDSRNFHII
ncbi:hypothetical protein PHAVU_L001681 [Phaseolus vulgaris]|uniref:Uncharacterized protein n=1 Tax=Phaseolus vulgaris TaxID=3885 RepID=A0ACC3P0E4_PHAVU